MTKYILLFVGLFAFAKANSQPNFETSIKDVGQHPKEIIVDFFDAFHKRDTVALRKMFSQEATLQSVVITGKEEKSIKADVQDLLISLSKIPLEVDFKEDIISIDTIEKDYLCVVTAPYIFKINDSTSHRGTNIFTLFKIKGCWKIASIIDSRIY